MVRGFQTKAKCSALDQEIECAHWGEGVRGNAGDDPSQCMDKCPFTGCRGLWGGFSAAAVITQVIVSSTVPTRKLN